MINVQIGVTKYRIVTSRYKSPLFTTTSRMFDKRAHPCLEIVLQNGDSRTSVRFERSYTNLTVRKRHCNMTALGVERQECNEYIRRKELNRTYVNNLWVVKGIAVFIIGAYIVQGDRTGGCRDGEDI